jgi:hypothetical protein
MKLDFDFMKNIIREMPEFANIDRQIFSVVGFDEAVAVVENIRTTEFPCVLVEDIPDGNISFKSGFCDNRTVSIWTLYKAQQNTNAERKSAFLSAFEMSKVIMGKILVAYTNCYDNENFYIDFERGTAYMPRGPLAGNVYGYEFVFVTKQEIGLMISD